MATTNKFEFGKVVKALSDAKRDVPVLVANDARKYFVGTFKEQGFDGKPWKEVQRRIPGTSEYKYPKTKKLSRRTSPILVRTGKLRREVNNSIRQTTWHQIKLGISDATPYAAFLNDAQKFDNKNMPRRQFMGNSKDLMNRIKNRLQSEIRKVFGK